MKKLNLLPFIFLMLLSFSCSDNDEITVILNQSGTLVVKVMDGTTPIPDTKVYLYQRSVEEYLEDGYTDAYGIYDAKELIQDLYTCRVYAEKNGITYTDSKNFQILAGNKKMIELNPYANVGNISLQVLKHNYYESEAVFSGAEVILIPTSQYLYDQSLADRIAKAHFKGKTDQNGWVKFTEVPAEMNYRIVVYKNNYEYEIDQSNYIFISRSDNFEKQLKVYIWY